MQIADIFRAHIVDLAPDSLIIEVTGDEDKIDSLQHLLSAFGVLEVMRTGKIALSSRHEHPDRAAKRDPGKSTQAPGNGQRIAQFPKGLLSLDGRGLR